MKPRNSMTRSIDSNSTAPPFTTHEGSPQSSTGTAVQARQPEVGTACSQSSLPRSFSYIVGFSNYRAVATREVSVQNLKPMRVQILEVSAHKNKLLNTSPSDAAEKNKFLNTSPYVATQRLALF